MCIFGCDSADRQSSDSEMVVLQTDVACGEMWSICPSLLILSLHTVSAMAASNDMKAPSVNEKVAAVEVDEGNVYMSHDEAHLASLGYRQGKMEAPAQSEGKCTYAPCRVLPPSRAL